MIVAIIPARGGSKGLPKKNIRPINGLPLIAWSIIAAKSTLEINKVVVSTDCLEIASISKNFDAEVLIRPPHLSTDEAKTIHVVSHVSEILDEQFQTFVVLQPTSPIRHKNLISDCITRYKSGGFTNLATGFWCKFREFGSHQNLRRQDLKGFFYDDGSVYILNRELVVNGLWFGNKTCRYINSKCQSYEIDDPVDFLVLESLFKAINNNPSLYDIY